MTTRPSSPGVLEALQSIVLDDRYTLVRPLASGGMAEIFLARQKALAGFEKDVVIKLLKERYRHDRRVVGMFLDEARVGAILNHPNIVHLYDVGEFDGAPYIVMEYIAGEELSTLCRRGLEAGAFLPLEHAVDLVRQAAEGMGFFHAKRDAEGAPLAIVHRDISPTNLLVTRDGGLKIIDFGIAKSSLSGRHGGETLNPGKANYMAPEQARGEAVDHRADIFSLGIVLYEITVGKRLFKGRPEEVLERVAAPKIKPPTFVRRDFPPELERIIMRTLDVHPDERYASAYELAYDLGQFLHSHRLRSGPVRIAQYLDELEAAEGGERRPELVLMGEAWTDDEGEDVLDLDRSFAAFKAEPEDDPGGDERGERGRREASPAARGEGDPGHAPGDASGRGQALRVTPAGVRAERPGVEGADAAGRAAALGGTTGDPAAAPGVGGSVARPVVAPGPSPVPMSPATRTVVPPGALPPRPVLPSAEPQGSTATIVLGALLALALAVIAYLVLAG